MALTCCLFDRRRNKNTTSKAIIIRATPPATPPTIGPTLLEDFPGVGGFVGVDPLPSLVVEGSVEVSGEPFCEVCAGVEVSAPKRKSRSFSY